MKFLLSAFLACLLFSCQPSLEWEGINLKEYFFQLDNFETRKVLVHDRDSLGFLQKRYWVLEKLNDNQLALTEYNHNFKAVTFLVDEYRKDGVYSLKYGFVLIWDNIDVNITHAGPIFPFENPNHEFGSGGSYRIEKEAISVVLFENELHFVEITSKEFNDEQRSTLIAKGTSEFVLDVYGKRFEMSNDSLEIWYTKGIGITKFVVKSSNGLIVDQYVKTISFEEFEQMRRENIDSWGYVSKGKDAIPDMLRNICSIEGIEINDLYSNSDSVASDPYEQLVLVDSLKVRGFEVVNSGRGNWQSGPRIVSRTLVKGDCECEIHKLYYTTEEDRIWRVTERIKCMQITN